MPARILSYMLVDIFIYALVSYLPNLDTHNTDNKIPTYMPYVIWRNTRIFMRENNHDVHNDLTWVTTYLSMDNR